MENALDSLVWKYAGFFDADRKGGKYEIWFLLTDAGDHVAKFTRYNERFIESNREFLEEQMGWHEGPHLSFHKWYRHALPWQDVMTQLDNGKVLFDLSDSGTYKIDLRQACTLEPVSVIERELTFFDEMLQELDLL